MLINVNDSDVWKNIFLGLFMNLEFYRLKTK